MDKQVRARLSLRNPIHFCAVGFGSGLSPWMPGTFGTLAGLPLVWACLFLPWQAFVAITLFICVIGVPICGRTADDLKVHDHGAIVWDEIAGIFLTFILVPISWQTLLAGFILFRFFDIVKPWPISYLDKTGKGGLGIMADDILAGIFACLSLHGLLYFSLI